MKPLLRRAGITRVADITGLDWIGIPVYQAIRPNSRNISVSQGKGVTHAQARVSALMESVETFHAEEIALPTVHATVGAMRRELCYDPYTLALSTPSWLTDETLLEWVPATDLSDGAPTWVPKQLCELNFGVEERLHVPLFQPSSDGLASGNTYLEAVMHGLCEVIERDATSRVPPVGHDPERVVASQSVHPRLAGRILERVARAGMVTHIVDVSGPTGLPCFLVHLDDPDRTGPYAGSGCHFSRLTALLRALTEAAQSRLAYISGSRDDLRRRDYGTRLRASGSQGDRPAEQPAAGSYRDAPTWATQGPIRDLDEVVGRVRTVTGASPLAVDLTRPDFGVPVVRVVAPGLRPDLH
jgi:ribosomal protein S12 methylthiotransferase accessory factor